jgi:hypothetical protein
MDEKISLEAIATYGDAYADKVINRFFSGKNKITGPEILSLCDVQQVNLFVIRELFRAWKEETRKQKSTYFDYENVEVKEALTAYMSVLSNHISIERQHFAPLLKKAVSQTLLVILNPYDFFSLLVAGRNNVLEIASFREEIKYLKINKAPLERMLHTLEQKKVLEVSGNEAFGVLDQILEEVNFTPEDVDDYIAKFSSEIPLNPTTFYVAKVNESIAKDQENKAPSRQNVPKENRPAQQTVLEARKAENKSNEATVNDRSNNNKHHAVLDSLGKIAKIKESLSINQKFMFTKVLFYGDFESFSRAIDDLDQLSDMTSALNYLERHSSAWDRDSKEFHEFMELVEKRFG